MNLRNIRAEVDRLSALVDRWASDGGPSAIERDLALDLLRRLYEQLRFDASTPAEAPDEDLSESEALAAAATVSINLEDIMSAAALPDEGEPEPDAAEEKPLSPAAEPEYPAAEQPTSPAAIDSYPTAEPERTEAIDPHPAAEPERTAPTADVSGAAPKQPEAPAAVTPVVPEATETPRRLSSNLFGLEELPMRRHKHRVLMSLYGDESEIVKRSEPAPVQLDAVTPQESAPAVLLDAEPAPAAETPAAETPTAETATAEVPATEIPAEEIPTAETPAAEITTAEITTEEITTDETAAAEVPVAEMPDNLPAETAAESQPESAPETAAENEPESEPASNQADHAEEPLPAEIEIVELPAEEPDDAPEASDGQAGDGTVAEDGTAVTDAEEPETPQPAEMLSAEAIVSEPIGSEEPNTEDIAPEPLAGEEADDAEDDAEDAPFEEVIVETMPLTEGSEPEPAAEPTAAPETGQPAEATGGPAMPASEANLPEQASDTEVEGEDSPAEWIVVDLETGAETTESAAPAAEPATATEPADAPAAPAAPTKSAEPEKPAAPAVPVQPAAAQRWHEMTAEATDRPAAERPAATVLADVIGPGVRTVGDTIASQQPPRAARIRNEVPVTSIAGALGLNDRFVIARDLFGGDTIASRNAIATLDAFDNFDDCMIYITEHYEWNPDSDGAGVLMEAIERKLLR